MELSIIFFLVLLACVGLSRIIELRISREHQKSMSERHAKRIADPHFRTMAGLHVAVLGGAAIEVIWLQRPFIPMLAVAAGLLFALATALRWWAIYSLGTHWNVQIMDSVPLGVVTSGPFRWVRHPNYVAVFVEMAALPLIHAAWITSVLAVLGNLVVLRRRLQVEEVVLGKHPEYQNAMSGKPRFLPRFF